MVSESVSTTGQVGTVLMASKYTNASIPFQNRSDMSNQAGSSSAKSTVSQVSGVECDPAKGSGKNYYLVRTGPLIPGDLTASSDIMEYDKAKFFVAFDNFPNLLWNQQIGELYVTYTLRLSQIRRYVADAKSLLREQYISSSVVRYSNSFWLGNQRKITVPSGQIVPDILHAVELVPITGFPKQDDKLHRQLSFPVL